MKPKLILTIKDKQTPAEGVKTYPPKPDPIKKPRPKIWDIAKNMQKGDTV